jgi:hypothetical protein
LKCLFFIHTEKLVKKEKATKHAAICSTPKQAKIAEKIKINGCLVLIFLYSLATSNNEKMPSNIGHR